MGLAVTSIGFSAIVSVLITKTLAQFKTASPSCAFYYYMVLSLLMLLVLVVMYIILAKRYKLREWTRHVNIQAIVEDHYERYFDQEEEYMREFGDHNRNDLEFY